MLVHNWYSAHKKLTISYNTMHKKTNDMSSRSAMEDGPRKSPRKTAGNKPHYLAGEYNKHKGGKGVVQAWVGQKRLNSYILSLFCDVR
jgi:hypothetical protein